MSVECWLTIHRCRIHSRHSKCAGRLGRRVCCEQASTASAFDSGEHQPLEDGPDDVFVKDNAGMLDIAVHPDFATNAWIYYCFVAGSSDLNTMVIERARLAGVRLVERERIFAALPWFHNSIVYGCRIVFRDSHLFVSTGDRWDLRHLAQSPGSHPGKIMRLREDGTAPDDNPYAQLPGAAAEVWAIGTQNPQGLAVHPVSGDLWEHEHGPLGGDEINIIRAGRNYGWPVVTFGKEYSGATIGEGLTFKEGMEQPVRSYVPSIAPSDMLFYTGSAFPGWRGNLFLGALAKTHLARLVIEGETVIAEEQLLAENGRRVRLVEQGPDGFIYIGVDDGRILRLVPTNPAH